MFKLDYFSGGVYPKPNKNTLFYPTKRLNQFPVVRIPMSMHIGPPCNCIVKKGDQVLTGQVIGEPTEEPCVPIHSSVSGTVRSVHKEVASSGRSVVVVEIESDGQYTFHPDVKPPVIHNRQEFISALKDSGLVVIMLLGILLAVWSASGSVADEIEGKTALTVLSKPVGRRSFILGKFLGIVWTLAVLFAVLGLMLLIVVAYKPIHEARETATQDLTWQLTHMEMVYTVPSLALAFMETVVLAAISVAISTRLPLLANFTICLAIYLLGHLTPLIVQSAMGQFVFVQFFGQLIATILPNLDHFRTEAAVAAGLPVPLVYVGTALLYCVVYSLIAMLLALALFEDRDLA